MKRYYSCTCENRLTNGRVVLAEDVTDAAHQIMLLAYGNTRGDGSCLVRVEATGEIIVVNRFDGVWQPVGWS